MLEPFGPREAFWLAKRFFQVPRYLFHMVRPNDRIDDQFGTDFPDLRTACLHAVNIARELEPEAFGPEWIIVVAAQGGPELVEATRHGEVKPLPKRLIVRLTTPPSRRSSLAP
jgi:hypothetical protein